MAEPKRVLADLSPRRTQILARVREVFGRLFGLPVEEIDLHRSFVEMGADSLALLQASKAIQDNFGVKISFRLLLDEVTTIPHLAEWIDQNLEEDLPQLSGDGGSNYDSPSEPSMSSENGLEAEAASDAVQQVYAEQQGITGLQPAALAYEITAGPSEQPAYEAPIATPVAQPAKSQRSETVLAAVIREQLQVMTMQLQLLSRPAAGFKASPSASLPSPREVVLQQAVAESNRAASEARRAGAEATPAIRRQSGDGTAPDKIDPAPYIAYQPLSPDLPGGLNQQQKKALEELIDRVNKRTPGSKRLTEEHRPFLADSRVSAGFRLPWKEIAYQIIFERALGARLWDVDGNEYVDITMGFGSLLFGHSPAFIRKALHSQIEQGIQIGPHISLAGKVARLLCEMTGNDRAAFCNSGTEAVMTALRLARTVTGRSRIAIFAGNFHGTFDQMLVKGEDVGGGRLKTIPMAPGIPSRMTEDVTLLRYDTSDSLEFLQANGKHFAAIMLAPVPSRRPDVQLKEYIGHLRRIASETGAVLIFDEVVTGFRVHPGGAQALYGVPADLVTYGKAVGGGMPIGVIAGKSRFMDPIDGGSWRFGDSSYPEAETTLFAGTFFKHPLVMASAWAVLNHIHDNADKIYGPLAARTRSLADTLNGFFEEESVPIRVASFTSFFMFQNSLDARFADLFFYYLLERGVYVWEGRTCFLSTAHTEEDIDRVIVAVKGAVAEMRKAGFLSADRAHYSVKPISPEGRAVTQASASMESSNGNNSGETKATRRGKPTASITIPLTDAQKQILWLSRISPDVSSAYNQSLILRMRGPVDVAAMRRAIGTIIERHEALRTTFSAKGDYQIIHPRLEIDVDLIDWSGSGSDPVTALDQYAAKEARTTFDLAKGPLLRASIIKLAAESYVLLATFHHIISDGVSLGIFMSELGAIYAADRQGITCKLPEPKRFVEYAELRIRQDQTEAWKQDEAYWLGQFSDGIPILNLPADYPRPDVQSFAGAQQTHSFDPAVLAGVKELSKRQECTLFIALLSAFNVLLRGITRQEDLIVGVLSASQSFTGDYLFGYGVNLLPLRFPVPDDQSFRDYLVTVKRLLFDAYEHQDLPFNRLVKKLNPPRDASRPPVANVVFNLDRGGKEMRFFDLEVEAVPVHNGRSKFDLTWYLTDGDDELYLECEYGSDLFSRETIGRWIRQYESILRAVAARPDIKIVDLGDTVAEAGTQALGESRTHLRETRLEKLKNAQRQAFPAT